MADFRVHGIPPARGGLPAKARERRSNMVADYFNHKCAECADFYFVKEPQGLLDGACSEMCSPCNSKNGACPRFRFGFVKDSSCNPEEKKGNKDE